MSKRVIQVGSKSTFIVVDEDDPRAVTCEDRLALAGIKLARQAEKIDRLEDEISRRDDSLVDMTEDERAIVETFVIKLMGEGRTEHGAMDLAGDERDLMREAADELDDTICYLLMERRRLELMRGQS